MSTVKEKESIVVATVSTIPNSVKFAIGGLSG